jgi:hypothetical protein
MRRCVERLLLACQAVASAKAGALNRNRKTPVRAIVSVSRGLPALPAPSTLHVVVEAVVSTAAHLGLGSAPGSGAGDSENFRESRTFGQWN